MILQIVILAEQDGNTSNNIKNCIIIQIHYTKFKHKKINIHLMRKGL